ncbi:response regulator [Pelagibacterium montanilacus]|uniref:response regulator n=1 Tax=Pelagibacterium montanilacus TaxID=2185280 RepID=UPI000F8D93B8|nr:response regulator [Pelagibacterium montanilacus]
MTDYHTGSPVFMLVDDQVHSARLLSRALAETDMAPRLVWLGDARRGHRLFTHLARSAPGRLPDMLVVDLKSHSDASSDFIESIRNETDQHHIPVAAIAASLDAPVRQKLLRSGAAAVFQRHPDIASYRAEIADLANFWVRKSEVWPIRA